MIDAKDKAEKPSGFPNADMYQMLAYCIALGLPEGHLVYAKGNDMERSALIRHAGIAIHCQAIDLNAQPDALLTQVDRLATSITSQAASYVGDEERDKSGRAVRDDPDWTPGR